MADLTADQYQSLILAEANPDSTDWLAANVALVWSKYQDWGTESLYLQSLWATVDALEIQLGTERKRKVDWEANGVSQKDSQAVAALEKKLARAQSRLDAVLALRRGAGTPAVGQLAATSILEDDPRECPNPNDRLYRGDPVRRRLFPPYT